MCLLMWGWMSLCASCPLADQILDWVYCNKWPAAERRCLMSGGPLATLSRGDKNIKTSDVALTLSQDSHSAGSDKHSWLRAEHDSMLTQYGRGKLQGETETDLFLLSGAECQALFPLSIVQSRETSWMQMHRTGYHTYGIYNYFSKKWDTYSMGDSWPMF